MEITLFNLVVQNLRRKPYRAVALALCVAVAIGSLFAITIVLRGIQNSLAIGRARLGADVVVVPGGNEAPAQEAFITGQPTTFYMDGQVAAHIAQLPGVQQTSTQVFVQTLTNARCCIGEFFLVGFDPETDFTISPWLASHLNSGPLGSYDIIVGDRILLREGETVIFFGTDFTVEGVLEKTGMGIDRTVYVPIDGLRVMIHRSAERAEETLTIAPNEISAVLIRVEPGSDVLDVAESIETTIGGVQAFTASQLNQAVARQMQGTLGLILGVTTALWLMSLISIGLVFSLIVNERQREFGLLRAMGARQGFVFRLVIGEATLLTGSGGIIGLAGSGLSLWIFARLIQLRLIQNPDPSAALSRLIQLQLHVPYLLPDQLEIFSVVLVLLILALFTGAIASLYPARMISKMEPYAAIRQGE